MQERQRALCMRMFVCVRVCVCELDGGWREGGQHGCAIGIAWKEKRVRKC